jgi:type IV pilus assembly protein PilV
MLNHPAACIRARTPRRRFGSGMTLVEVLVSLVVISVGLLGVAALQITSLRSSQASFLRTQATALADDIIDRMRANRTVALGAGHEYDIALGATVTLSGTPTRAERDKFEWKTALKNDLPKSPGGADADGSVQVVGTLVTVTIQWGERGDAQNPNATAMQFVTTTEI